MTRRFRGSIVLLLIAVAACGENPASAPGGDAPAQPAGARVGYYVSPDGSESGDGSAARPWDLAKALSHPAVVRGGDTIWVRAGTYTGRFTSSLRGATGAPIVVRAYPGERATIDGSLLVQGSGTVYWGFEVMNSTFRRVSTQSTSSPTDIGASGVGVDSRGADNRFVNLVIHDTPTGITAFNAAADNEVYGCLIYNNGWEAPDRGHGHGIYAQNATGTKRIADNIVFNQFGYGLHVYGSSAASLRGFDIEGNVLFTNGSISPKSRSNPDALVGGDAPAGRIVFRENFTYKPNGTRTVQLGYDALNEDVVASGNYVVGMTELLNWRSITFTGNTLTTGPLAPSAPVIVWQQSKGAPLSGHTWDANRYYVPAANPSPFALAVNGVGTAYPFPGWKTATGFESTSSYTAGPPSGVHTFVRRNAYEPGRAHVVVYNWSGAGSVTVDLGGTLAEGRRFEVRNAQDYYGAPVLSGTYAGGAVAIPLAATPPAKPLGTGWATPPSTGPTFHVFVVTRS